MATVTFPNSYLSTASQPWGRIVERQLVDLSLLVTSNEINNSARDKQLLASLNRTNATAISAQAAADAANAALADIGAVKTNIYVPGTTQINGTSIKTGTISADKITAGTLTGFTVQTASSGKRVILDGASNSIQFLDSSGEIARFLVDTWEGNNQLRLLIGGKYITFDGTDGGIIAQGSIATQSYLEVSGDAYISGGLRPSSVIVAPAVYAATTGSAANMFIGSNGNIIRSTSASKYKMLIEEANVTNYENVLSLKPKNWFDKNTVESYAKKLNAVTSGEDYPKELDLNSEPLERITGLIAEDLVSLGLDEFVSWGAYDKNGNREVEGIQYDRLWICLIPTIKEMISRLEALENK